MDPVLCLSAQPGQATICSDLPLPQTKDLGFLVTPFTPGDSLDSSLSSQSHTELCSDWGLCAIARGPGLELTIGHTMLWPVCAGSPGPGDSFTQHVCQVSAHSPLSFSEELHIPVSLCLLVHSCLTRTRLLPVLALPTLHCSEGEIDFLGKMGNSPFWLSPCC